MAKDFYDILGVSKNASQDEIKKAYRKQAMKYHPDRNPGDKDAEEKFKQAAKAYETLSNENKKSQYDQFGHSNYEQYQQTGGAGGGHGFSNAEDIFEGFGDIFGSMFGNQARQRRKSSPSPIRGEDLSKKITITLKEAFTGVKKTIKIYRYDSCQTCDGMGSRPGSKPSACSYCKGSGQVVNSQGFFSMARPCPSCNGQGFKISDPCSNCSGQCRIQKHETIDVSIPDIVFHGAQIRLSKKGDAGVFGGPAGDLYLEVSVSSDPKYVRRENNIVTSVMLNYPQLVLGCKISIKNIDDSQENFVIPAGCQVGAELKISGKGFNSSSSRRRGDFIAIIKCHIPKKLSASGQAAIKTLAEELGSKVNQESESKSSTYDFFRSFMGK